METARALRQRSSMMVEAQAGSATAAMMAECQQSCVSVSAPKMSDRMAGEKMLTP